ncbi:MAG: hypothetical protein M1823_000750 [Watsoniomyces obsoletus]|nr:MAG: hypothetical protein M1823_000750 [Watsoniomyces obsoletus]
MPSNRRMRALVIVVFGVLLVMLYLSADSRKAGSRDFYTSTVLKLKEQDAQAARTKLAEKVKESGDQARKMAENIPIKPAQPEAMPHGHDKGSKERKAIPPGQKTMGIKPPGSSTSEGSAKSKDPEKKDETKEEHEVEVELTSILKRSPIIIFSKSYCPYSKKAKSILLDRYSIVPAPFVVELDEHPLGAALQAELERTTGRRTVPNVLISGRSIGGGDEVSELDAQDKLMDKVRTMAGKRIMEAKKRYST